MRRVVLLAVMLSASPALAQDESAREQAIDMTTVVTAHELCGFDLSGAQEDAIAKKRQALLDAGSIDAADLNAVETAIAAAMKRQVPEGLCKPGGAGAKLYRRKLDALGHD